MLLVKANLRNTIKYYAHLFLAIVSALGISLLSAFDFGLVFFGLTFLILFGVILREMFLMRNKVSKYLAQAVSDNWFVRLLLGNGVINFCLAAFGSVYLSSSLMIYSNMAEALDFFVLVIAATVYIFTYEYFQIHARRLVKGDLSLVAGKLSLILSIAFLCMLANGIIIELGRLDERIKVVFDVNIPLYINNDVDHSVTYFQYVLRTAAYIKMNIQSIALVGDQNVVLKSISTFLQLSLSPFLAYLIFLSGICPGCNESKGL